MRVCLVSVEIFAWGKYGGFGRATRIIGRELSRHGVEVYAVVPRRNEQRPVEELDGIQVLSFKPRDLLSSQRLYREVDADIYHSQEPSMGTYLAMRSMPERKHVVTFRDPRDPQDWRTEFRLPSLNPVQVAANWLYEDNWLVRQAVRRADGLFAAAKMVAPKARSKYHLESDPDFLPTPVVVPENIQKADVPTVCFVSRWDKRKRPEIFFNMAKEFPNVRFLAAGKSRNSKWDEYLRTEYGRLPNLEMLGFIDQFRSHDLSRLLEKSWILVNTAAREGLPNAFIEAAAHGCAILSAVDPDGFSSQFGHLVSDDNFDAGLRSLLKDNLWQKFAAAGYEYVKQVFSIEKAIDQHLAVYERLISQKISNGIGPDNEVREDGFSRK
jgi:glycosyltransferase involved in cell wall biosynthesis